MEMKKKPDSKKRNSKAVKLISYKLGSEFYRELCDFADTQVDAAGLGMSPSQAARVLMLEALKKRGK